MNVATAVFITIMKFNSVTQIVVDDMHTYGSSKQIERLYLSYIQFSII